MSSGAGVGVTFLGTGAGVKKSDSDHLWCRVPQLSSTKNQVLVFLCVHVREIINQLR